MNPFDFVTAINYTKKDLMVDDETEKAYQPFLVNRSLSYFSDTVHISNAMNAKHFLDKKLQFHFLLNITRKKKRFSKWEKPIELDEMESIKEYYGYSNEKARTALTVLSAEEIEQIKRRIDKGGRR
jgi:hypothetical protein